ncbi:hypothetical protein [Krasilnikovia sp. M28-CT-15]|uniref:hypothetical protein n=1 Tax=Krasilnikovia sp. M28-CT-15 TaxID=3373540 RepID=UPI00399D3173
MEDDLGGHLWREGTAKRPPLAQDAEALGRLIAHDADPAEVSYYEAAADPDPDAQALDDAQRSHAGQYLRRVRRLRERERHAKAGDED